LFHRSFQSLENLEVLDGVMTAAGREKRAFASHVPTWQRFQTSVALSSVKTSESATNVYQRQYAHVYANRLNELKSRCWDNVPDNGVTRCQRVLDLSEDVPNIVVGTLIKEFGDKDPFDASKCRTDDILILEDESGRVHLKTDQVDQYATGAVFAVQGTVRSGGSLIVDAFYPPAELQFPSFHGYLTPSLSGHAPNVLFVSGLNCGDPNASSLQRDMLLAYLQGFLTPTASKVCRVIVAGCSTFPKDAAYGAKEMDAFLSQICATGIPVDLLPGMDDPTTANWPQRPIHSSLVKETDAFGSDFLSKTPNPYASGLGDKYVLGTDGRNVTDLVHYLRDIDSPVSDIKALEITMRWGHICPTGPDSVPTMPHLASDPMILPYKPHVYFAGNCSEFATKIVDGTCLLCIPKFSISGTAVLVNLETLGCELVRFDDSS
jgi:DNA polymerase delta subunit 2